MSRAQRAFALALILSAARPAAAQPTRAPDVRVRTDLVVLHVGVGPSDRPQAEVPCEAFRVLENGVPQEVSICEPGTQPLVLGLVVDSSTSMTPYRELLATAAGAFVRLGHPESDTFVRLFNERVRNGLDGGAPFTSDAGVVAASLAHMPTRGRTALFDAIVDAVEAARGSPRLKKAIVLVSDGGENASAHTFDEVVTLARGANLVVYAVAIENSLDPDANPGRLRRLAKDTGGLVFGVERPRDVRPAFERIARDLRAGYTLAYVSSNEHAGGFRTLRVEARVNGRTRVLRTRAGYLAATPAREDAR